MLPTDAAWLAGFIDGEGCFYFNKYRGKKHAFHANVILTISQAEPEVLEKVQRIVGAGTISKRYANSGKGVQHYRLSNTALVDALAAEITPFLGTIKRLQYEAARAKYTAFREEKYA